MSRWTWIDSVREETWLPGLRAAVLLLRAGQSVSLRSDAPDGAPYLAARDLPQTGVDWLAEQGLLAPEATDGAAGEMVELKTPAAAVFGGAGSPYNHAAILAALGVPWFYAAGPDVAAGALRHADVFVVPGGGWRFGDGQLADLGEAGTEAVRRFVEEGGGYLSSCAGSMIAMRIPDDALAAHHPTKRDFTLLEIEDWEPLRTEEGGHRSPGIGRVVTTLAAPRHPAALGLPDQLEITHYNGPIFVAPGPGVEIVVRFAGTTDGFTPSECFFGHAGRPTKDEQSRSLMAEAGRQGLAAIVAGSFGQGRVVMAGLHPEFGPDQGLDAWGRPAQLIGNAVLWLAQHGRGRSAALPHPAGDLVDAANALNRSTKRAMDAIERLRAADRRTDDAWLAAQTPRAAFGRTPAELWQAGLAALPGLVERCRRAWDEARTIAGPERAERLAGAVLHRYEPDGGPDLGAQGVVWLLEEASRLIDEAADLLERGGPERSQAEHRVTRSYLSAIGLLGNAAQRLEAEIALYRAEDQVASLRGILAGRQAAAAIA